MIHLTSVIRRAWGPVTTVALIALSAALTARADIVEVKYTGIVSGGTSGTQGDTCFFGPCNISLTGDPFQLVFSYDTSVGYLDGPSLLYGGSAYGSASNSTATLTINGFSVTLDGTLASGFFQNSNGTQQYVESDPSNFVSIQALSGGSFPTAITTGYSYPVGTDPSAGLVMGNAGLVSPTLAFVIANGQGEGAYGTFSGPGAITVSDLSAPEPQASLMMIVPTVGYTVIFLRRRRRDSSAQEHDLSSTAPAVKS